MTCVIGLEENGVAYIGADSAAVSGQHDIRATSIPKVFYNGDKVVGYTSSFRMGQILQFMSMPVGDPSDEYMVTRFAEAVREELKTKGYSTIKENEESGGEFIVAVNGCLYTVESDYQVQRYNDGLSIIGCGYAYAYGAMMALSNLQPEKRILEALRITAYYSSGVCAPFSVLKSVKEHEYR